jgi:predicted secreted protein
MGTPLAYLVAIALTLTIEAEARAADQTLRLAVGHSARVELEENPSTGYRWAVDGKASSGLSFVRISDRGFSERAGGKRLLGAPGIHRWDIQAVGPGTATVVFSYRRPWEASAVRSHAVAVEAAGP